MLCSCAFFVKRRGIAPLTAFVDQVVKGLESKPGIEAAATTSTLPLEHGLMTSFDVEGRARPDGANEKAEPNGGRLSDPRRSGPLTAVCPRLRWECGEQAPGVSAGETSPPGP